MVQLCPVKPGGALLTLALGGGGSFRKQGPIWKMLAPIARKILRHGETQHIIDQKETQLGK